MQAVLQAELRTDAIEMVTANDASRRSFTVAAGGQLVAVAGDDLSILQFPELRVMREVRSPDDEVAWDFTACFLRDHLVARLLDDDEQAVVIDPQGSVAELDISPGWLVPASDSWLTVDRTHLRRWTLTTSR